jgi:hypothetical protein
MTGEEYREMLRLALLQQHTANNMSMPDETREVRELVADLKIRSGRLSKILAKRVAGNVQEAL